MMTRQDSSYLVLCVVCVWVTRVLAKTKNARAFLRVQHFFRFSTLFIIVWRKLCFAIIYLSNKSFCLCGHYGPCETPSTDEVLLKSFHGCPVLTVSSHCLTVSLIQRGKQCFHGGHEKSGIKPINDCTQTISMSKKKDWKM